MPTWPYILKSLCHCPRFFFLEKPSLELAQNKSGCKRLTYHAGGQEHNHVVAIRKIHLKKRKKVRMKEATGRGGAVGGAVQGAGHFLGDLLNLRGSKDAPQRVGQDVLV